MKFKDLHHEDKTRLRKQARNRRVSKAMRQAVFERDSYQCVSCGDTEQLTIDHVIPVSKGGRTVYDNLQTMCHTCNQFKGNKPIQRVEEWRILMNKK